MDDTIPNFNCKTKISMILILLQYIKKILKTRYEAMKKNLLKFNYNDSKIKTCNIKLSLEVTLSKLFPIGNPPDKITENH